jgi:hypothetical protein
MSISVKEKLISEIQATNNQVLLNQLFELCSAWKRTEINSLPMTQFIGCLDNDSAYEIKHIICNEFQQIEGEW